MLLGVVWTLIDYNNLVSTHYLLVIFIKLCLLSCDILSGFKQNIVNKNMMSLKALNL
jgi:hypothetical protein